MRESTLIAKSSIRRASPQLRLRTGLAWGIAVAVDAWLVWLKWWRLPNTIREIIRMFPETAFLHDPAMLWQFVAASCLQVVVIASLYLAVARIPARWCHGCVSRRSPRSRRSASVPRLVIAHGFGTPGFVYSLGLAAAASLIATVALVHGQWRQWLARRKDAQRLSERLFAIHRRQPVAVAFRLHARARHEAQRGGVHAVPQTAPIGWPIVKHVPEVDLRVGRPHLDAVAPRDA